MARRREDPEVRKRELIEAAIRCLAAHGPLGASLRTIADDAGVALGLLRHHFGAKEQLLAATYRYLSAELADAGEHALREAGPLPVARLRAFVGVGFTEPFLTTDRLGARIALWSLSTTVPELREVHTALYRSYRLQLATLVDEIGGATLQPDAVAVLSAVLDGLWVEYAAGDRATDIDAALDAAVAMVASVVRT